MVAAVMTLHVLHAGDGYEYLTKQVATADRERELGTELTDYYTAHGTPPGVWFGSGLTDLEQMQAGIGGPGAAPVVDGAQVTEPQMKALFGSGLHPNAEALIGGAVAAGATADKAVKAARLGRKFPEFSNDIELLRQHKVAVRAFGDEHGHAPSKAQSQQLLDDVGTVLFEAGHQRPPEDKRELRSWISAQKSKVRQPVAGYDLVYTPPKSVSVMWALADDDTRRAIERIHKESVTDALGWIEQEACFTRTGSTSQEVQDTTGIVATLYDHYDSRAGDPNLHTHAVVSIKVCTESDGKWRALDGSVLHRYAVPASQRYNATVMSRLHTELGFDLTSRFTGRGRQDVIEIEQVPRELCEMFSSRRTQIETRRDQLVAEYRAEHGRMPPVKAMYALYQQANLDTRAGKQEPETLRDMQNAWRARSAAILGSEADVLTLTARWRTTRTAHTPGRWSVGDDMRALRDLSVEAAAVVERLENARSHWAITHVHGAVAAHLAAVGFPDDATRRATTAALVDRVLHASVHMPVPDLPDAPDVLRRRDGELILTRPGSALHTSAGIIAAEESLLHAARTPTAFVAPQASLHDVLAAAAQSNGRTLNAGQRDLAEHFVGAGTLVAVGVGPAGTGKTTAMKAVSDTWRHTGHNIVALAPSAVAAETLGEEIGVPAHTLATLTYPWRGIGGAPRSIPAHVEITAGTMLLVDEASLASTKDLAALTEIAAATGAVVRLLGDPNQLDAVEAGGTLRLLAEETRAPELTHVVRFGRDTEQAENSLALRRGETDSLEMFYARGWVHEGTATEMKDTAVVEHLADTAVGLSSIVMLPTRDDVREVNLAVQAHHRGSGIVDSRRTAALSDELTAGVGDTVITRENNRTLRTRGGRRRNMFVRNGDLWTVTAVDRSGALVVRSKEHHGTITLPASYVRKNAELGYAATVHRNQGVTVDVARSTIGSSTDRAALYVQTTRGRLQNHLYVPIEPGVTIDTEGTHLSELGTPDSRSVLTRALANDHGHIAALTVIRDATEHAQSPDRLREAYLAAHTRLRDQWIDTVLDTALPSALHATAHAEHPGSVAALRASLGEIHDRGDSARRALNDALAAGELHTARDVAGVLTSRIRDGHPAPNTDTTDAAGQTALPPLPPRTTSTDKQLDDYARIVADRYTAARPDTGVDASGIGARIRSYDTARADLDTARVHLPVTAAFDPATAHRLLAEPGVHRLGRHLRTAALTGLSPQQILAWHAEQLTAAGRPVTAAELVRDVAPAVATAATAANTRWAERHDDTLRRHFPLVADLADHTDDPRWTAAIGRLRELTDHGGHDLDQLCQRITSTTHTAPTAAGITAALDDIAAPQRAATDADAPDWVPAPDLDAHLVDPASAELLHITYTDIAHAHTDVVDRIAHADDDTLRSEFEFTRHLLERPDDPDIATQWNRTVADIHAYRDRGHITDTTSVAGDRPDDRTEHATYHTVHRHIDDLGDTIDDHHRTRREDHAAERRRIDHDTITEQHRLIDVHHQRVDMDEHHRRGPRL